MHRRLFTFLSALSLLLFLAVCLLWVRSYWVTDIVRWEDERIIVAFVTTEGEGGVWAVRWLKASPIFDAKKLSWSRKSPAQWWGGAFGFDVDASFNRAGFAMQAGTKGFGEDRAAAVPLWFPAILTAVLPAMRLRVWWRGRRNRPHPDRCAGCGYDLRATPDRCPECGRAAGGTG